MTSINQNSALDDRKQLFKNAKQSKDTWDEEEMLFKKNSGNIHQISASN